MVLFEPDNPVVVGFATQKPHYDRLWDNTVALRDNYGLRQTFRGLHLRTHPNNDIAAAQVQLLRADEIVFDDGFRDSITTPLTANIAAAGVGGLDTGAEAASTWYEAWAVRKSTDGTRGLILHRAKDYFLDETYLTGADAASQIRYLTGNRTKVAQGFKVDTSGLMEFADVTLIRSGAVVGSVWLTVEADVAGFPSGTPLATSDKLDASKISTSNQTIRFVFRTPATLTATTQYHLVATGDWAQSDTVHIAWACDVSASTYANGAVAIYQGGAWAAQTRDAMFRVYVTRNDLAVTMPAGYDQKVRCGFFYNNSGSNLVPATAFDRLVSPLVTQALATVTVLAPTLVDLSALVPPIPVALSAWIYNTTNGALVIVSPVPDGFGNLTSYRDHGSSHARNPTGTEGLQVELQPVLTEYQACYLATNLGNFESRMGMWRW